MNEIKKLNVLIVDDEEIILSLLKKALTKDGHNIFTATSKQSAFDIFSKNNIDLLVVDKNLSDGSGLDLIEALRNLDFDGEVIIITGYSDTDSAIRAVELGAFRYIRKPFDLDAIKMDIERALETSRLKKELFVRTQQLEHTNEELLETLKKIKESEHRRIQTERLASIGYLSAGIAHEINNPLSLLSMTIPYTTLELNKIIKNDLINKSGDQAHKTIKKLASNLEITQEAVDLLMLLATDLHSLGRSDNSEPQQVVMADVVNSALRIVRHKLKRKAKISVDIPDHISIMGKQNRLIQVFINLLTNAGRAIKEEKPDDNFINIKGYKDGSDIIIEISDSGIGIPEENIKKIFDRFVTTGENKNEGSGIGLSIVQQLVEEHKGRVEVKSEYNKGTTFTVIFPESGNIPTVPPPMSKFIRRDTPQEFIRAKRFILFIDKQLEHLENYNKSFGQMHNVIVCTSNEEALNIIEKKSDEIDIIVTDITNDAERFNKFYNTVIEKYNFFEKHFICTSDIELVLKDSMDSIIPVLVRPFRPAELLASIYRIPPRRITIDE